MELPRVPTPRKKPATNGAAAPKPKAAPRKKAAKPKPKEKQPPILPAMDGIPASPDPKLIAPRERQQFSAGPLVAMRIVFDPTGEVVAMQGPEKIVTFNTRTGRAATTILAPPGGPPGQLGLFLGAP